MSYVGTDREGVRGYKVVGCVFDTCQTGHHEYYAGNLQETMNNLGMNGRILRSVRALRRFLADHVHQDIIVHYASFEDDWRSILTSQALKHKRVRRIITVHRVPKHQVHVQALRLLSRRMQVMVHAEVMLPRMAHLGIHAEWVPWPVRPQSCNATKEDARNQLGLPLDKTLILCFGSPRDEKGIWHLLEAAGKMEPHPLVVIAGVEAEITHAHVAAFAASVGAEVRWLVRYVTEAEVALLHRACDVVALPYTEQFAGQSGCLMDAIGCHSKVVVSPYGELGHVARKYGMGVVLPSLTPNDIAGGINEALGAGDRLEPYEVFQLNNGHSRFEERLLEVYNK